MTPRESIDLRPLHKIAVYITCEKLYWQSEIVMSHAQTVVEWQKMQNPGDGPRVRRIRRNLPGLLRNFGDKAYNVGMCVCMLLEWSKAEWYGALGVEEKAQIEENIADGTELVKKVLKQILLVRNFEKMLLRNLTRHNSLVLELANRRRQVRGPPPELMAWMAEEFA